MSNATFLPAYLGTLDTTPLDVLPMLPSGKADRQAGVDPYYYYGWTSSYWNWEEGFYSTMRRKIRSLLMNFMPI